MESYIVWPTAFADYTLLNGERVVGEGGGGGERQRRRKKGREEGTEKEREWE